MTDFFDSTGRRIPLGKKLGSGGEGAVHEVPAVSNQVVAKIYHHPLAPEKQAKIQGMVQHSSNKLKKAAAWPLDTLHITAGGQIRGFLMPKLTDYEPIHHLYNPADRKQRYPDKDWEFLITVARNTAIVFEIVHGNKHVIGDVNPNLVFVAANGTVKLIDCDSFQTFTDGKHHLCEVGVSHFTPPELQNHSSFRSIHRTPNHDNFGLALLIFHLLLMGRHPFAGVFAKNYDMPVEKSIAEFRYVFSRNAAVKGMAPPLNSVTTAILSPPIAQLFERAFTESGQQQRPTAKEWGLELEVFRKQLSTCKQVATHRYFNGLAECTWCLHEQKFNHQFFIAMLKSTVSNFDLTAIWSKIIAIIYPIFISSKFIWIFIINVLSFSWRIFLFIGVNAWRILLIMWRWLQPRIWRWMQCNPGWSAFLALVLVMIYPTLDWLQISRSTIKTNGVVVIKTGTLNVRNGAGEKYTAIKQISKGTKIFIKENLGEWSHIQLLDGTIGYVSQKYIRQLVTTDPNHSP